MVLNRESTMWKAIELAIVCLITTNVTLTGWSLRQIVGLKSDMAAIQANRFTSRDGMVTTKLVGDQVAAIWREISSIREDLAKKANTSDVPPPEVLRRMKAIEEKLDQINERIHAIAIPGIGP